MENTIHDSVHPNRDTNGEPTEYESTTLTQRQIAYILHVCSASRSMRFVSSE